jgi:hypothetical protein
LASHKSINDDEIKIKNNFEYMKQKYVGADSQLILE